MDVSGNKVFFLNKENGQEIATPYKRQDEVIWGICMYDDETQPQMTGTMFKYARYSLGWDIKELRN